MVNRIMRAVIAMVGSLLGGLFVFLLKELNVIKLVGTTQTLIAYVGSILLFGIIFFLLTDSIMRLIRRIARAVEQELEQTPTSQIMLGGVGLILGLVIASLISQPIGLALEGIPVVGSVLRLILIAAIYLIFGYIGVSIGSTKRDELQGALQRVRVPAKEKKTRQDIEPKVFDTSVIIDGRIAEIIEAGFLEGDIVIPVFVLLELQHIADSQDSLRRQKGRRGLDIINQIKQSDGIHVIISDKDYEDTPEVDSKLIRLAKDLRGKVVTTDYNLNKMANVHGIQVLNINDLANAMKPIVIPGEEMTITVIKDGKEHNQGLAYLDDGTMIVVENGRRHIGHTIQVLVTSILQTSAGKMIFAKPK